MNNSEDRKRIEEARSNKWFTVQGFREEQSVEIDTAATYTRITVIDESKFYGPKRYLVCRNDLVLFRTESLAEAIDVANLIIEDYPKAGFEVPR